MIIDQLGVFFDDVAVGASMTSKVLNIMSYAGRGEPIYISILAKGGNTSAVKFAVTVQQSHDRKNFTDLEKTTFTKEDALPALNSIRLPISVKKKHVRLMVDVSGTITGGSLFAGITRDHFAPYDEGQFINKGKVIA